MPTENLPKTSHKGKIIALLYYMKHLRVIKCVKTECRVVDVSSWVEGEGSLSFNCECFGFTR
jgi:hypothetical protein